MPRRADANSTAYSPAECPKFARSGSSAAVCCASWIKQVHLAAQLERRLVIRPEAVRAGLPDTPAGPWSER